MKSFDSWTDEIAAQNNQPDLSKYFECTPTGRLKWYSGAELAKRGLPSLSSLNLGALALGTAVHRTIEEQLKDCGLLGHSFNMVMFDEVDDTPIMIERIDPLGVFKP